MAEPVWEDATTLLVEVLGVISELVAVVDGLVLEATEEDVVEEEEEVVVAVEEEERCPEGRVVTSTPAAAASTIMIRRTAALILVNPADRKRNWPAAAIRGYLTLTPWSDVELFRTPAIVANRDPGRTAGTLRLPSRCDAPA